MFLTGLLLSALAVACIMFMCRMLATLYQQAETPDEVVSLLVLIIAIAAVGAACAVGAVTVFTGGALW